MSNLYGTVTNERGKTSTRAAHRIVTACAQSWMGSVSVTISTNNETGEHVAEIAVGTGSNSNPSRIVWSGALSDLVNAPALAIGSLCPNGWDRIEGDTNYPQQ